MLSSRPLPSSVLLALFLLASPGPQELFSNPCCLSLCSLLETALWKSRLPFGAQMCREPFLICSQLTGGRAGSLRAGLPGFSDLPSLEFPLAAPQVVGPTLSKRRASVGRPRAGPGGHSHARLLQGLVKGLPLNCSRPRLLGPDLFTVLSAEMREALVPDITLGLLPAVRGEPASPGTGTAPSLEALSPSTLARGPGSCSWRAGFPGRACQSPQPSRLVQPV